MSAQICVWPDSSSRQYEFRKVPWEAMVTASSMQGCVPAQNVAVPCAPAGEGSARSYTCLVAELGCIRPLCSSKCFYVTTTSVYSARYLEVFHYCQFVCGETEVVLQGWRADEKGTEVPYLSQGCHVCNRKQGL